MAKLESNLQLELAKIQPQGQYGQIQGHYISIVNETNNSKCKFT